MNVENESSRRRRDTNRTDRVIATLAIGGLYDRKPGNPLRRLCGRRPNPCPARRYPNRADSQACKQTRDSISVAEPQPSVYNNRRSRGNANPVRASNTRALRFNGYLRVESWKLSGWIYIDMPNEVIFYNYLRARLGKLMICFFNCDKSIRVKMKDF